MNQDAHSQFSADPLRRHVVTTFSALLRCNYLCQVSVSRLRTGLPVSGRRSDTVLLFPLKNNQRLFLQVRLHELDPAATYVVQDADKKETAAMSGKELMSSGLTVTLPGKPAAALITYQKKR